MDFAKLEPGLWVEHRNTLRATVIDVDDSLNPAFRVAWEQGGTNWYKPETANDFTPVPLLEDK